MPDGFFFRGTKHGSDRKITRLGYVHSGGRLRPAVPAGAGGRGARRRTDAFFRLEAAGGLEKRGAGGVRPPLPGPPRPRRPPADRGGWPDRVPPHLGIARRILDPLPRTKARPRASAVLPHDEIPLP